MLTSKLDEKQLKQRGVIQPYEIVPAWLRLSERIAKMKIGTRGNMINVDVD